LKFLLHYLIYHPSISPILFPLTCFRRPTCHPFQLWSGSFCRWVRDDILVLSVCLNRRLLALGGATSADAPLPSFIPLSPSIYGRLCPYSWRWLGTKRSPCFSNQTKPADFSQQWFPGRRMGWLKPCNAGLHPRISSGSGPILSPVHPRPILIRAGADSDIFSSYCFLSRPSSPID
jgi:hypothetical protein